MNKFKRFFLFFILPQIIFLCSVLALGGSQLIEIFNILNLSLAVGVVVAYAPVVFNSIFSDRPLDRADWLGIGIFLSWFATIELRTYSIIWRWMDQPLWLTQSEILSYALFCQTTAAIFHLAAPGAINNRIPTRRWINIGIAVTLVVIGALALGLT